MSLKPILITSSIALAALLVAPVNAADTMQAKPAARAVATTAKPAARKLALRKHYRSHLKVTHHITKKAMVKKARPAKSS